MYLDPWVAEKINIHISSVGENVQVLGPRCENVLGDENGPWHEYFNCRSLTREALDTYSENKRVELVAFLMEKSPFYKKFLNGIIASTGGAIDISGTMDASEGLFDCGSTDSGDDMGNGEKLGIDVAADNRGAIDNMENIDADGSINSVRGINSRKDTDPGQLLDLAKILVSKWELIPFTCAQDIISQGEQMLCVHPSEISRIISQTTSGTTGPSKRIYFTPQDQELTLDYFHHGMKIMVAPGDKVLILLPHKSPGSLGFLLQESLFRLGAEGFFEDSLETLGKGFSIEGEAQKRLKKLGYVSDVSKIDLLKIKEITAIVGPPSLIVSLTKTYPSIHPHSILMTADFVAGEDRKAVKDTWGSRIFEHYGMTEMGLGCAMSCRDTEENMPVGYHIRENDLYIEIVDPVSTKILPQGEWGEIVVTTLTRMGMPLLRYRTGDTGRFLKDPCSCGSVLKRLDRVQKRSQSKNINE